MAIVKWAWTNKDEQWDDQFFSRQEANQNKWC